MDIDIVIPYRASLWHDNELRYALRGAEKFFPHGKVFIVTDHKPKFLKNVIHIHKGDTPGYQAKERNVKEKLVLACENKSLSETFLFMNDDHFFLSPAPTPYPSYFHDYVSNFQKRRIRRDGYTRTIHNTVTYLKDPVAKYFDIHFPIMMSKSNFPEIVNKADWSKDFGYLIKSLYANKMKIRGTPHRDLKIDIERLNLKQFKETIKGRPMFSTADTQGKSYFENFLKGIYPNKSKYEI